VWAKLETSDLATEKLAPFGNRPPHSSASRQTLKYYPFSFARSRFSAPDHYQRPLR
jgi:hypothetical protein